MKIKSVLLLSAAIVISSTTLPHQLESVITSAVSTSPAKLIRTDTPASHAMLKAHERDLVFVAMSDGSGSAVRIGNGVYATAKHVIEGVTEVKLYTDYKTFTTARKFIKSDVADVALIITDEYDGRPITLKNTKVHPYETVYKLGFGMGNNLSSSEGKVLPGGNLGVIKGPLFLATMILRGGDSGGAVYNSLGELVGINDLTFRFMGSDYSL